MPAHPVRFALVGAWAGALSEARQMPLLPPPPRRGRRPLCLRHARCRCCLRVTGPDEDVAVLISSEVLRLDEFGFEITEESLIQVELPQQRPIRDALPVAQEVNDLIENRVKVHAPPSHACGGDCGSSAASRCEV